jgi:hypothetical protein
MPLSSEREDRYSSLGFEATGGDILPPLNKDMNMSPTLLNLKDQWLVIDPYSSLNAMHITNWRQVEDIKLLVKLKLAQNNYQFDAALQRDLENYIKLKQKQEAQKKLLKDKKSDNFFTTSQICKDLTKFMKDNK